MAENMFDQVNDEGNRHVLFEDIIDHQNYVLEENLQYFFITT